MNTKQFLTPAQIASAEQLGREIGGDRVAGGEVRTLVEIANERALDSQDTLADEAEELARILDGGVALCSASAYRAVVLASERLWLTTAARLCYSEVVARTANAVVAAALMAEVSR